MKSELLTTLATEGGGSVSIMFSRGTLLPGDTLRLIGIYKILGLQILNRCIAYMILG